MIGVAFSWAVGLSEMMTRREVRSNKFQEILEELISVMSSRGGWIDSLIPPIVFILLNALAGLEIALWGSLGIALLIAAFRLIKSQHIRFALGGIGGVIVAMLFG